MRQFCCQVLGRERGDSGGSLPVTGAPVLLNRTSSVASSLELTDTPPACAHVLARPYLVNRLSALV